MSIHKKLQEARLKFLNTKLTKTGKNIHINYKYFQLEDFLPAIQRICAEVGICGTVHFQDEMAALIITDVEDGTFINFSCPMSTADLKGNFAVQNLGAVITYLRRYLWTNAFEITEHDLLTELVDNRKDNVVNDILEDVKPVKKEEPQRVFATTTPTVGGKGEFQIIAPPIPDDDIDGWFNLVETASLVLLNTCTKQADVLTMYQKNKQLFNSVKIQYPEFFTKLMAHFTETKNKFPEETK